MAIAVNATKQTAAPSATGRQRRLRSRPLGKMYATATGHA
jgi:hypothetical protein